MTTNGLRGIRIEEDRLTRLAAELVRHPSVGGEEGEVAAYLGGYLEEAGFSVELQPVGPPPSAGSPARRRANVVARLGPAGARPVLLLTGHIDVVPPGAGGWSTPPYGGEVREGSLYGRGSADMKGGVAAMVEAAVSLRGAARLEERALLLAFVVGEEVDQSGTRAFIESGAATADWAIVGEPTELKPVVCHKGLVSLAVTVTGRAAHASRPEEGQNAIDAMHALLTALGPLREEVGRRTHPLTGRATLTPGTIRGGEVSNMVPAECSLELDRRLLPGESPAAARSEVEAVVEEARRAMPQFGYEVRTGLVEEPMESAPDSLVAGALRRAVHAVRGSDPGVHGWSATCDAGLLSSSTGTPTVVFGPGTLSQAHRPDEHVALRELADAAGIYAFVASELLDA